MKNLIWSGLCCGLLFAGMNIQVAAQQQGTIGTFSLGSTKVNGLTYKSSCNGLQGPAWYYTFTNSTAAPITLRYSFSGMHARYSHVVPPHARWTLRRVSPQFPCSSSGPLVIQPK